MIMSYAFYGHESQDVFPINQEFAFVKNQRHLYDLLSEIWCLETCAPRLRKDWSKENMTLGQCSITAFLVQDIFGGLVYGVALPEGGHHCFNNVNGIIFDLTSEQFGGAKLDYEHVDLQTREEHFKDDEKYQRYLLLKKRLLAKNKK